MSLTILNCGRNCSGFSAALSLSSSIHENEGVILLNAGDSTQKFCNEYKIKLRQVSSVFLTSLAPHNISGLPALLLSLSDLGNKNLDIIGQIGTSSLLESMKVFTNRRFPELNIREISSTENILIDFAQFEIYPILATGTTTIVGLSTFITLQQNSMNTPTSLSCLGFSQSYPTTPSLEEQCQMICNKSPVPLVTLFVPIQAGGGHNSEQQQQSLTTYFQSVCSDFNLRGLFADLHQSNSVVEFRQAQISLSMNFLSYPNPLLPSEEDNLPPFPFPGVLETVQTSRTPQQINDDNDNRLGWREWISQSFPHGKLIAVEPFMSVDFSKSEDLQIQTVANQADDIAESLQNFELSEISEGRCRLILNLSDPIVVPSSNHAISQQLRSILQKRRLSVEVAPVRIHQKPKGVIYFLGTGSASPSRHRSNSAILCRFNSLSRETSLLLDAGEGCVSQLFQSCQGESTRMRRILQSLSIVWISHHHADHHCGLSHLLEEMIRCNRTSKLLVIAPSTVISYHQYIVCVGGFDHLVEFIPIELTLVSHPPSQHEFSRTNQQIMASTNLIVNQFQSIRVPHCHDSFGLMFTLSSREKFVYSGDCRPSKQLVLLGMNCHLLIHEATFEDDRSSDAKTKRHSTISEGIQIGIEMRAKHTILTHLSQRYPRTPSIDRESNVTIAHDFLQVLVL